VTLVLAGLPVVVGAENSSSASNGTAGTESEEPRHAEATIAKATIYAALVGVDRSRVAPSVLPGLTTRRWQFKIFRSSGM
jgi:hypothetical protein